jgi:sugar phosphate isomerase/epimerase
MTVGANKPGAQVDPVEAASDPEGWAEKALRVAQDFGMKYSELFMCQLHVDGRGTEPNDPDPVRIKEMLAAFRGICRFARLAGFRDVMGVPGSPIAGRTEEEAWRLAVETQKAMVDIAGEEGACYAIEPYRASLVRSPADTRRMLDEVPGLKIALDYSQFIGAGFRCEDLYPLQDSAVHLHAKPCGPGVFKALVHEDRADWPAIIGDLKGRGWSGVISAECIYDTRRDTLTQNAAFQNILMAHRIELCLRGAISEVTNA